MIFPEFPEHDIKYGIEQNTGMMIVWVKDMISMAIQNPDVKSEIASEIFEKVHFAGYCEGSVAEQHNQGETL